LIRYGFLITDVNNADTFYEQSTLSLPFGTTSQYEETIKMLRLFLDFVVVEEPDPRLSSEQKS
jgi:hypothetical protein